MRTEYIPYSHTLDVQRVAEYRAFARDLAIERMAVEK